MSTDPYGNGFVLLISPQIYFLKTFWCDFISHCKNSGFIANVRHGDTEILQQTVFWGQFCWKYIFQKLVPFVEACPELSAYLFNQSNSCQTDIVLHQNENPSEPTCPCLISEESVAADTKSLKMAAETVIRG